jgi:hypothetical protein
MCQYTHRWGIKDSIQNLDGKTSWKEKHRIFLKKPLGRVWRARWYDIEGKNQRTRRKTCLGATLFTRNPTWTDQE